MNTATTPDINVIIATRNRASGLEELLHALAQQQTNGRFSFDVLVADNGSTDETRQVVEQLRSSVPVPLRYLYEARTGKPWALNRALQASTGRMLAFIDDDVRPTPGWLGALWTCLEEGRADAVGGRVLPHWTGPRPAWLSGDAAAPFIFGALGCVDHGDRRLMSTLSGQYHWLVGGNLALRRELVQQLGGFDVRMRRGQDTEYAMRCLRHGKRVMYEPTALAYHKIGPDRLTPAYFRRWWHQRGYFRAYRAPWTLSHLVTVEPLLWYWDVCRFSGLWFAKASSGRPWAERFLYEVRLRERISEWTHRAQLLPSVWSAVLKQGPRLLRGTTSYLDLEQHGFVNGSLNGCPNRTHR